LIKIKNIFRNNNIKNESKTKIKRFSASTASPIKADKKRRRDT
jgi:hypothetical protein